MTTRTIKLVQSEFYHVYNRGTDKRIIFKDQSDYVRFIELLFLANTNQSVSVRDTRRNFSSVYDFDRKEQLVHIGAYCLMPNHFHILLTPATEDGIQKFMLKLSTGYSMYFNKKYERTGGLFEGRFKSQHADSDEYLKYLFSYIHLNPVKLIQSDWKEVGIHDAEKAMLYLGNYTYSSFLEYTQPTCKGSPSGEVSVRQEAGILSREVFPEYFLSSEDFYGEIMEWIMFDSKLE